MTASADGSAVEPGETLGRLVADAAAVLVSAGIESARLDARLLAAHALGLAPEAPILRPEAAVGPEGRERLQSAIRRRSAGEPVSRILKRREFWSLEFEIGPAVLDPRPDSEAVVAAVLDRLGDRTRPWRILDLGTGSGCLLLALLSELPAAEGIGVDISAGAAAMARGNALRLGLGGRARFVAGDWASALAGRYDAIVSNPPYIPSGDLAALAPEVTDHDPRLALDGGGGGLDHYRAILAGAAHLLAPSGLLALEFGEGQGAAIEAMVSAAQLAVDGTVPDLAGRPRCLLATPARRNGATPARRNGPGAENDPETIGFR
ncbi:MAG: peptide chain release factor N(5)-glutamine methyltransferase [Rhodospirillaceae bacterium]|jgi:release factor glutamine methyltransferase|nr:peptide chain release factor N(5)-glutamine methyltransferase [Rhodospirillaceae bacterium]MBT6119534.1 peptide chain release factor N(5)-glutamine methyltransferase [Rhodospirillaceae bacterium]